jgi:hypothetical protein
MDQAKKTAKALKKLHSMKSAGDALQFLQKLKASDPATYWAIQGGRKH